MDDGCAFRTLYVTDAELIRRLGVGEKTARVAIGELERRSGFPKKDPLFGDKRYWPAVKAFLDDYYNLNEDKYRQRVDGGYEQWPNYDGTVKIIHTDGRVWNRPVNSTDPKSWQKKRELKPRTPPS